MNPDEDEVTATFSGDGSYGILPGTELVTSGGERYVVTGVLMTRYPEVTVGIKRSTWWRRLYWRVRRWFS